MSQQLRTLQLIHDLLRVNVGGQVPEANILAARRLADGELKQITYDAQAFELDWLLRHVREKGTESPSSTEEQQIIEVRVVPRLEALLRGELPAERALREGRAP